jgi:hypothetical protein
MKNCAIAIALTLPGCTAAAASSNLDTLNHVADVATAVEQAVCQPPVPAEAEKLCVDVAEVLQKAEAALEAAKAQAK